ncbi:MAG: pitrilysin family protein [Candidatus Auribacterota bacterium]|jgi:zinc protease|nr:pitrilysin family protein [Candidatus Auribacterota bacterium]
MNIATAKSVRDFRILTSVFIICMTAVFFLADYTLAQQNTEQSQTEQLAIPYLDLEPQYSNEIYRILPSYSGEYFVVLNSGLSILVKELPYTPVVSCRASIRAGSIYEEEYLGHGISHYCEHIVSRGTTSQRAEAENIKMIDQMGGASNASTSLDQTTYFINTTPEHWKTAVSLWTSFMESCVFDPKEVAREREVILQEFKLGQNDPRRQLWYLFMDTAYQTNNAKYPTIGYEELFKRITREDLLKYYRKRYQPQNTVFSVAGNIDGIDVLKEIIDLTRSFQRKSESQLPLPKEEDQIMPRWAEKVHPSARLTSVQLAVPTVSLFHNDLYALDVMGMILGSGMTSRFYKSLKDDKQLVLSVSAVNWTPSFARGVFMVNMNLQYDNVKPAIDAMWEVIDQVKLNGITIEELDRAKQKIVTDQIYGNLKAESVTSNLAYAFLTTGDPHFDDRYVQEIRKVTLDDIKRVSNAYLDRNKQTVAIVKPPLAGQQEQSALAKERSVTSVKKIKLSNGMRVLFKSVKNYPLVHFTMFLNGGLIYEDSGSNGISDFVSKMLTRGTTTRSKDDIARIIENIGGQLSSSSGNNTCDVRCTVMTQDVYTGVELLADVVLYPSFPQAEIDKLKNDTLLAIEKLDESWSTEVTRFFKQNYFKDHPYKYDNIGTVESINALTRNDIESFYKKIYVPSNMVLAVYGNFDETAILNEIKAIFEPLPAGTLPPVAIPDEKGDQLKESVSLEKISDKYSATIMVGYPGISIDSNDKFAFDVIDAAISGIGYPSGWLQDRLRGGNSNLVYLVHAFPQFGISAGFFAVLTQTTVNNYHKVMEIITSSIEELKEKGLSDDELKLAKNTCITMNDLSRETIASQSYNDALYEILGLGYEYDFRYSELINSVTAEDILRVANRYFTKNLTVTVFPAGYEEQLAEKDNEPTYIPSQIKDDIHTH